MSLNRLPESVSRIGRCLFHRHSKPSSDIQVQIGNTKISVKIINSPFGKKPTEDMLVGIANYMTQGLRTGGLPQLAEPPHPSFPLVDSRLKEEQQHAGDAG